MTTFVQMEQLRTSRLLMIGAITLITLFQCYWINRLYYDEKLALQKKADLLLNETLQHMQSERIRVNDLVAEPTFIQKIDIARKPAPGGRLEVRRRIKDSIRTPHSRAKDSAKPNKPALFFSSETGEPLSEGTARTRTRIFMNDSALTRGALPAGIDSILKTRSSKTILQVIVSDSGSGMPALALPVPPVIKTRSAKKVSESPSKPVFVRDTLIANKNTTLSFFGDTGSIRKFMVRFNAINDSIPLKKLDSAYSRALKKASVNIPYRLHMAGEQSKPSATLPTDKFATSYVSIGLERPFSYQAELGSPFMQILTTIKLQLIFSLLMLSITTVAFVTLYRSLRAQHKLAAIKNEFISNITHELKTPIATVSVALEALKNFNALQNPAKTVEYLDISEAELQRLSLLVDKVLRLSMFENDKMELNKEHFNLEQLVREVVSTMKLQADKMNAEIVFNNTSTESMIYADKLHLTSVLFNLLDNSLKYGKEEKHISVLLERNDASITLSVKDDGIGIAPEYRKRIFDKFFRVPVKDKHNIKGYGLGLSYVQRIVEKHNGSIAVESEAGKGSNFIIQLPVNKTNAQY